MTVAILDDHPVLGLGLSLSLQRCGVEAVALCPNEGEDHAARILREVPDVELVLSDLMMPAVPDTAALIEEIAELCPVVVLSGSDDAMLLGRCLKAGALGIMSKDEPIEEILDDIVGVLETGTLRPTARVTMLQSFEALCREEADRVGRFECLTSAEREVLRALCEGRAASRIADERFVSLPTVRTQIKSILAKLEVGSQLEAVALANRLGFLALDSPEVVA